MGSKKTTLQAKSAEGYIVMSEDLVPLPLGKITPSLIGSYSYNTEDTPDWLIILCPNCGSDNVCVLDPIWNRDLEEPQRRWFCISCQDSWKYGYEI